MKRAEIIKGMKSFANAKISDMATNNSIILFTQPIINRVVDNMLCKADSFLALIEDKNGCIDIEAIVDEMINNLITTKSRSYDDKDGKKVYVTEVVANSVQFLSTGSSNGSSNGYSAPEANPFDFGSEPAPARTVETVSVERDPFESFGESVTISDNDLPF